MKAVVGTQAAPASAGYLHERYADSMSWLGRPRQLPRCAGQVLVRQIGDSGLRDAMGCYPIFSCKTWDELPADIERELGDLVSLTLVTDPFGAPDHDDLLQWFDVVRLFKLHNVIELTNAERLNLPEHHSRRVRSALRSVHVERAEEPLAFGGIWANLYAQLATRHDIHGSAAIPADALIAQLEVPGVEVFIGRVGDDIECMTLWYVQGDVAYYHLGASSEIGYRCSASYGVFGTAIEFLASRGVHWVDLGAGAGVEARPAVVDGLQRFKSGWSTDARPVYLCGRILDHAAYARLGVSTRSSAFFPRYRSGELA